VRMPDTDYVHHLYDKDGRRVCDNAHGTEALDEISCHACLAEKRHRELLSVLLEINQNLSTLLTERRGDISLTSISNKLDDIKYIMKNR
jgi:hypothetical protein